MTEKKGQIHTTKLIGWLCVWRWFMAQSAVELPRAVARELSLKGWIERYTTEGGALAWRITPAGTDKFVEMSEEWWVE